MLEEVSFVLGVQYMNRIRDLIDHLEINEADHLRTLAEHAADRIATGSVVYLYDHGHMLNHELFHRAGGLALLGQVALTGPEVTAPPVRPALAGQTPHHNLADTGVDRALARFTVKQTAMRSGDLLLIASAAGRAPFLVELALAAKEAGVETIGFIASQYAEQLPPLHASGHLLHQIVDHVVDLQTAAGDAELSVPGLDERFGSASGIMGALMGWMFMADLTEAMIARQMMPTVFRSLQYPDGPERLRQAQDRYHELGY